MPVLSKHANSMMPPVMTLFCEMQKIFFLLSLYKAYMIPKVMLTGSAGGTAIRIISISLMMMSEVD